MEIVQQKGMSGTRLQHAASRIDRLGSVDVRYLLCIYWPEKITTCIIALRDRVDSPVDVRYLLCISWPEKHHEHSSHIDRFDSPVSNLGLCFAQKKSFKKAGIK